MTPITQHQSISRLVKYDADLVDLDFPQWARRSNPLVRRQLGVYWKMVPPDAMTLVKVYLFYVAVIALSLIFPFVFRISAGVAVASVLLMPLAFVAYARILMYVAHDATIAVIVELRENTLALLRITPLTLRDILMSKVAAAVWRRAEDLSMVIWTAFLLSLPLVLLQYTAVVSPQHYPIESRLVIFAAFTVSLGRLLLEPIMVGAIGTVVAIVMPFRFSGALWTMTLTGMYFTLINLPRLLNMSANVRLLLEIALPVIVPLVVTWGAFRLAVHLLLRD